MNCWLLICSVGVQGWMLIVYFYCMLRKLICFQAIKSLTYWIICASLCPSCWIRLLKISLFLKYLLAPPHTFATSLVAFEDFGYTFFGVWVGWLIGLFSPSLITPTVKRRKTLKIKSVLLQSFCDGCFAFGAVARCSAGWRFVPLKKKLAENDCTFRNGCLWKIFLL